MSCQARACDPCIFVSRSTVAFKGWGWRGTLTPTMRSRKGLHRVLQCVAVCCSVLQCVAVCCSVLQCVAVCCSVSQCVAVCRSVLQCAAVCCSVLLLGVHRVGLQRTYHRRNKKCIQMMRHKYAVVF